MLTSFFGKSNPINYLLLAILIFGAYVFKVFVAENTFVLWMVLEQLILGLIIIFSMFLLDFIIRKNNLSKNNTYGIFLFTCFLIACPAIFFNGNIILANTLLLMALRRILSFRTDKNMEKKILDAALWIALASFFYFWSLLFFFVLYFALIKNSNTNHKQLLIPIVGFSGVFVLAATYHFLTAHSFDWFFSWKTAIGKDFSVYNFRGVLLPTAIIFTFLIWTGFAGFFKLGTMSKKEKPNAIILLLTVITMVIIGLTSEQKSGAEVFFILGPLVIIIANYIENIEEFWFKEVLLWLALLLPIIVLIL